MAVCGEIQVCGLQKSPYGFQNAPKPSGRVNGAKPASGDSDVFQSLAAAFSVFTQPAMTGLNPFVLDRPLSSLRQITFDILHIML